MTDPKEHEILKRIADYERLRDAGEERAKLVALWRKHHPEAAQETSSANKPLVLVDRLDKPIANEPDEQWTNDTYFVTLRRHDRDRVFGTSGGMIQLGIAALDGTARHDWREFQAIKNQLAGEETEAFELYPAESRLLDPSNYYTLWCFPGLKYLKVGIVKREVLDADRALAPQRAFAKIGPNLVQTTDKSS